MDIHQVQQQGDDDEKTIRERKHYTDQVFQATSLAAMGAQILETALRWRAEFLNVLLLLFYTGSDHGAGWQQKTSMGTRTLM